MYYNKFIMGTFKYTKETLISLLHSLYKELGRVPVAKDLRSRSGYPNNSTYINRFGSWNNALVAAGFTINKVSSLSQEDVLLSIKEYVHIFNDIPFYQSFQNNKDFPSASSVERLFGSWNNAILAAGFLPRQENKSWSKDECIKAIQLFNEENNRPPRSLDFIKSNSKFPNYTTIMNKFGSWNKGIEAAGFVGSTVFYGAHLQAKDGDWYRSHAEVEFVNKYLYNVYKYYYELPYGNGWYYDFYLPEKNLYIEIDGGLRPERIKEKIEYHKENNIKCAVISTDEVFNGKVLKYISN